MLRLGSAGILAICAAACGGAAAPGAQSAGDANDAVTLDTPLPPVQAGSYRLRLSASCERRELTATGTLTLKPIAGGDARSDVGDAVLLWGQADLDLEQLAACLGGSGTASPEAIHPSLLVEVLRWDGEPHHPVLLVSTDSPSGGARRRESVGIAMWVERIEHGNMGGVWSRWDIMGREEGRWEAELVSPL
jgi:hypothetical protein